jgi:class 3 adenylate cyclase
MIFFPLGTINQTTPTTIIIPKRLQINKRVRIGISSGIVVVGAIGKHAQRL